MTERRTIPFSEGEIELVRTSVGGALGEEQIELSFNNAGDTVTFFEGASFSEFQVEEHQGKIRIQMCKGLIRKAEPFGVRDPRSENREYKVMRLDIDWNCRDKSRET